jgi:two-component system response regulator MprA
VFLVSEPNPARSSESALILVVERDPHVRALETYFLQQAGYTVEFCEDGEAALVRARALLPVIVVSEILIPRRDGISVCRRLKQDPATRHILVLIFSILAAEDRAREAGADGFLRKPVNDALLIRAVERLLAQAAEGGPTHGTR